MGDPIGAAAHVRQSLAKDGTWMIVEPFANDQLKDNLNPVGRVVAVGTSVARCPPHRSVRALVSAYGSYLGWMAAKRVSG
jgi:hypothetical protein